MGVSEAGGGLGADRCHLREAEAHSGVEKRSQAPPAEILENEVRPCLLLAPVEHPHDVRLIERGRQTGLSLEPPEKRRVHGQHRMQQLDRDAPPEPRVARGVHLRGRTGTDGGEQPIPAADNSADLFCDTRHEMSAQATGWAVGCGGQGRVERPPGQWPGWTGPGPGRQAPPRGAVSRRSRQLPRLEKVREALLVKDGHTALLGLGQLRRPGGGPGHDCRCLG